MAQSAPTWSEKDLHQWDLLATFRRHLLTRCRPESLHPSWADPRRHLSYADYLSVYLFGLLNPVLKTMQALCSASELDRVRRQVCTQSISLGSFSEAQHLVDPGTLEGLFGQLCTQIQGPVAADPRAAWQQWFARDSSLFAALPRMSWALYGGGKAGAENNAVRLHLSLHLLEDKPARAQVTLGKTCERKVWKADWEKGAAYVGDRYFAEDYRLLSQLEDYGCRYVLRLRESAAVNVEEELPISLADQAAGITRQAWVRLGARKAGQSRRVRVVWIATAAAQTLRLVTNVAPEELNAAEVGLLYRRRWQIECFFKWVKCLLGCRHWLAESATGVTIQLYLALIASVLLQLATGRRPSKRMLERIQFYQLGWATLEELLAGLDREQTRAERRKIKTS